MSVRQSDTNVGTGTLAAGIRGVRIGSSGACAPIFYRRRTTMSYVQHVLQPGEEVRHTASLHWIVYWPGTLTLIVAIVIYGYAHAGQHATQFWDYVAGAIAIVALVVLFREWFNWWN